jgi:hypothetical protein
MARLTALVKGSVLINAALAAAAFALFLLESRRYEFALGDARYFNGWVLVGCLAVMMQLTLRKRVVILPFGRVRRWLLLHYYLGLATIGVFLVHTRFRLPESPLNWLLWCLFVLVTVSGLLGWLFSKTVPPRLNARGERILFDRIPLMRRQLADEAESLALESVKDGSTESIARLYTETLGSFFAGPRNRLSHLQGSTAPIARVRGEMASVERYLDDAGKARLAKLRELVEEKNELDFHYANEGLLRLWLFLHVPPTYAMLAVATVHVALAYAFTG